jgi:hypothetical protein
MIWRNKVLLPAATSAQQDHRFPLLDVEIQPIQYSATVILNHKIANGNDGWHQCFPVK